MEEQPKVSEGHASSRQSEGFAAGARSVPESERIPTKVSEGHASSRQSEGFAAGARSVPACLRVLPVLLWLAGGLLTACAAAPSPKVEQPLVQELEQAPPPLELSAEEMGLRYLMAVELSREGEWRAAMRHLELVAERRPDHWAIQILFAEAAYFLGEPLPRVRNALNLSLRQKPNNPRALSMLGQIAEDEGDLDEAETQYRAALASRGEELTPVLGLVRVLRRQGRAAEAVEILQNHIGEHGVTPRLLLTLASTQEHAGDLVGAQLSFERAATEHPDPLQGHLQLYQFFVRNKLTQEAAALAKTIERLRRLRDGERELRPLAPSSR